MKKEERSHYFDNLKAVLIFLVVLGHFLRPVHDVSLVVTVKRLIYVFHMPLFVFTSGFFAKRLYQGSHFRSEKILALLKAYVIFVLAIQLLYAAFDYHDLSEIDFLRQSGAPWYLLSLSFWYLTVPVVRNLSAAPVLAVSVLAALLAGYDKDVGDFLCLSRTIVFGPFFYLGYYLTGSQIRRFISGKRRYAGIVCGLSSAVFVLINRNRYDDEMEMVYENTSYNILDQPESGALVRLVLMLFAFCMAWALMSIIPNRRTWFSWIGRRTMAIYMLHRLVRDVFLIRGFYQLSFIDGPYALPLLTLLSLLVTLILSQKAFSAALNRLLAPWHLPAHRPKPLYRPKKLSQSPPKSL